MNKSETGSMNEVAEEQAWPPFRILCVDDNRDYADSVVLVLGLMGLDARACYDGANALLINESFRPGVCFIDLNMPGMDGDALAMKLRTSKVWRPLLIVAVTAMSNDASKARIAAAGFDMHLVKPVNPAKLIEVTDLLFRAAERGTRSEDAAGPRAEGDTGSGKESQVASRD